MNKELQELRGQRSNNTGYQASQDGLSGPSPSSGTDGAADLGASAVSPAEEAAASPDSAQDDDWALDAENLVLEDTALDSATAIQALRT